MTIYVTIFKKIDIHHFSVNKAILIMIIVAQEVSPSATYYTLYIKFD